jgi:CRISPR-associated protein Cmr5
MSEQAISRQQSLDQRRAERAYENVTAIDEQPNDKLKSRYSALARKVPAMIQTNGLGQALAFLRAKAGRNKESEHWLIYGHISAWVMKQLNQDEAGSLLEWVVQNDSPTYRRATNEAMAFLNWLKRWAEAILPEPAEEE